METKKDLLDNLELRSENVQDILTTPPHWMIRWGNTLIFIILLMVLMMSYFIKYPEFIPAPILVTSQNPPEKLEARTNSKTFEKEDFDNFRKLFDLIREIKELGKKDNAHMQSSNKANSDEAHDEVSQSESLEVKSNSSENYITVHTDKRKTDVYAHFYQTDKRFVIKAGSKLAIDTVSSFGDVQVRKRKKILRKQSELKDNYFILKEDIEFSSPSGAINFATGGNMNGWNHWLIVDTGKPLRSLKVE